MIDTYQLIEWFDSQVKRIDRLLEEKGYYVYHDMPELYESQLREQRYYYSMTIIALTSLVNIDKHFPKIEAWEEIREYFQITNEGISINFSISKLDNGYYKNGKEKYTKIKKALEVSDE